MQKPKVYFLPRKKPKTSFVEQVRKAAEIAVRSAAKEGDLLGIKVHFGEEGNTAYVPPVFIRLFVEEAKKKGARPFLFDTNTLYKGKRENARDHLLLALRHGFTYEVVEAPLMIADGLKGKDYVEVEVRANTSSPSGLQASSDSSILVSLFRMLRATLLLGLEEP